MPRLPCAFSTVNHGLNNVRGALEWIVKDGNRAAEVIQRVRTLIKKTDTRKGHPRINDAINDVVALCSVDRARTACW